MFYYIVFYFFPIGLVKTEFDVIVWSFDTGQGAGFPIQGSRV